MVLGHYINEFSNHRAHISMILESDDGKAKIIILF